MYGSEDFDRDIRILRAKKYFPVGYSSFNGGYEDTKNAAKQAKAIGATIVLVNSKYTDTQTNTSMLFLPDNKTTFHSGTVSANTTYNNPYGGNIGSSNTAGTYRSTSTTYGTKAVPITTTQRRYNQMAVYLVKSTEKPKFGVYVLDLTPEQRAQLQRNTGALLDVIVEDSPAFFANVLAGDVLLALDGEHVRNGAHASELMSRVDANAISSTLTVVRNGAEIDIEVLF